MMRVTELMYDKSHEITYAQSHGNSRVMKVTPTFPMDGEMTSRMGFAHGKGSKRFTRSSYPLPVACTVRDAQWHTIKAKDGIEQ